MKHAFSPFSRECRRPAWPAGVNRFFLAGLAIDGSAEPPFSLNVRGFRRTVPQFRNIFKYAK